MTAPLQNYWTLLKNHDISILGPLAGFRIYTGQRITRMCAVFVIVSVIPITWRVGFSLILRPSFICMLTDVGERYGVHLLT